MNGERRGVILYGHGADAVAEALRELDPRYLPVDGVPPESAQVPVLRCENRAEADDVRKAAPDVAWQVVALYRPGDEVEHSGNPVLWLNTSKIDPRTAARAVDQADLVVWYEVINPIRVTTADGGPAADDYSNFVIVVPDGYRTVAHAVTGATAPECLPSTAERVLRSHDLWVLARLRDADVCENCVLRHG
ncbi:hypothetical protein [Catellatospora coxensis]|uniref:Uncharacterized protein n=1 Tax=Catellatospora coxensis TaxID=310354 RepID=A0A8J3P6C1_9ACTN|nr:hypothetical protein [Catellatospora coxensis]GIG05342.1 hypothetical protein Cco03nite_20420 [Catellatospora coxensis]